jgi:hypothetical protein
MADFAFASVVPVASPIQTFATSRLNGCTLRPLTSSGQGVLNVVRVEAGVNRIETCTLAGADDLVMQRNKAALPAQTNTSPNRECCLPLSAIKFRGPVATDVVRQSSFPLNLVCRARSRFSRMRRMRAF